MLPDRVSNPGPLTYESGALPIALRGPALHLEQCLSFNPVALRIAKTGVLAVLNAIGLREVYLLEGLHDPGKCAGSHKSCLPL